jgi:hypothetical protein
VREAWGKVAPVLFYVLRASFGVALVASIALIFTTIIYLLISSKDKSRYISSSSSRSSGSFSSSLSPGKVFGDAPFNIFYYDSTTPYGRNRYTSPTSGMSFLEAVFSFLFGDGDPNAGLEARRTSAIAQAVHALLPTSHPLPFVWIRYIDRRRELLKFIIPSR